jgi:RNA polymerase sigma-70 factor (ECF subfamily)
MTPSSANSEEQDRHAMAELAGGHDAALTELMDRYGERLFHFFLRELQNETEAADLAEETFVRIYQNRERYDAQHRFATWMYAIAANLVRDRYRWRSRHPEVATEDKDDPGNPDWINQIPGTSPTPGEDLEQAERAEAVRTAIAALPEELRTPLILAQYEGLSQAEIADILDCSAKAVEMKIYRARQELKKSLAPVLTNA